MTHYINWLDVDKKLYSANIEALSADDEHLAAQHIVNSNENTVGFDVDSFGQPAEYLMEPLLMRKVPFKMYSSGGVMGMQMRYYFDGKDLKKENVTDPDPLGVLVDYDLDENTPEFCSSMVLSEDELDDISDDGVPF